MPDEETKPIWQSKTVIAATVAMVVGVLGALGVGQLQGEQENLTEFIMQLVTAIASGIAIWGRIVADKKLK